MSASKCPHCSVALEMKKTEGGVIYACSVCGGFSVGLGLLKRKMDPDVIQKVWRKAAAEGKAGAACPTCPRPMSVVTIEVASGSIDIDVCTNCYHVWFDKSELEKLSKGSTKPIDPGRPRQKPLEPYGSVGTQPTYGYSVVGAIDIAVEALDWYFTDW